MDQDAEKFIRSAIDKFAIAYRAGDLESLLNYYSEDLIKVRQGAAPEPKAIAAGRIAEVFRTHKPDIHVTVDEVQASGNLAYTNGTFEVTLVPKTGGETVKIARRYLEIWRKEGDVWRVFRTMDNQ